MARGATKAKQVGENVNWPLSAQLHTHTHTSTHAHNGNAMLISCLMVCDSHLYSSMPKHHLLLCVMSMFGRVCVLFQYLLRLYIMLLFLFFFRLLRLLLMSTCAYQFRCVKGVYCTVYNSFVVVIVVRISCVECVKWRLWWRYCLAAKERRQKSKQINATPSSRQWLVAQYQLWSHLITFIYWEEATKRFNLICFSRWWCQTQLILEWFPSNRER